MIQIYSGMNINKIESGTGWWDSDKENYRTYANPTRIQI